MPFKKMANRSRKTGGRSRIRRSPIYRKSKSMGYKQVGSISRLQLRGIHYFKRTCQPLPMRLEYTVAGLQVQGPTLLTSGGAQVLGYSMGSNANAVVANNITNGATGKILGGSSASGLPNTSSFGFSITFSLQQVIQHLEFTGLFDRYKIVGAKVDIIWHCNTASVAGNAIFPTLYYVYDGDDASVPLYASSIQNQEGLRTKVLSKGGRYSFYCRPRQLISTSTTTTGATNTLTLPAKWNNSADAGTNHYAMKFFVDDILTQSGTQMLFSIHPTLYFACKDTI